MAVLNNVKQQWPRRQFLDCSCRFLFGFETFEEADVGADFTCSLETRDALFVAELLVGVRTSDELDI